jgi:cytochrome c-type biogenesis protein CcmH/NrfG
LFVIACEKVDRSRYSKSSRDIDLLNTFCPPPRHLSYLAIARALHPSSFNITMAPNMRPFAAANLVSQVGRRAFTTQRPSLIANRAQWTPRPIQHQIALRQTVRRATSDAKPPKPKRRFRVLRWTWRLTQLSAIAGLAYVGYGIYEVRNPHDQPDPHPSKKTLVVLGT